MSAAELAAAGRVLDRDGVVDAFGHVSVREGDGALITPPRPLAGVTAADVLTLPLGANGALPAGVPREAWIHTAIYTRRPDVMAICRAQPPSSLALAAVADALYPLHGQAAMVGAPVPVFDEARLVRVPERAAALAERLGVGWAVILRGNGAVTAGATVGQAVARMTLLERSARVHLAAAAAGDPRALSEAESAAWQSAAEELLERYWDWLRTRD